MFTAEYMSNRKLRPLRQKAVFWIEYRKDKYKIRKLAKGQSMALRKLLDAGIINLNALEGQYILLSVKRKWGVLLLALPYEQKN